jgi:hypothetical protein
MARVCRYDVVVEIFVVALAIFWLGRKQSRQAGAFSGS